MGATQSTYIAIAQEVPPHSDSELLEYPPVPNEAHKHLHPKDSQVLQLNFNNAFGRWISTTQLSVSAFLENNAGLLLVAAAQFWFCTQGISVKWLESLDETVPIFELIWIRMITTYICSVAYMYWRGTADPLLGPKGVRMLLVFRGVAGSAALCGTYFALQHLSLSDVTVLKFFVPFLTGLFGAMLLKEPYTIKEILAGLCSFVGVILVARPQFLFGIPPSEQPMVDTPAERMRSVLAALVCVVAMSCAYTTIRAIGKRAHAIHSVTFHASQSILLSTIGMVAFQIPPVIPSREAWLAILLIGVSGFIAQTLLTNGLQLETAGRGTLAMYTSVVFAIMFDSIIFHTTPPALSIAGAAIIMSSGIYITLTKAVVTEPVKELLPTASITGSRV
ncbi:hypothetical protein EI94DRAFT_1753927 [Lactarius quietus]|nr:hypothetical protein EI94DRAFT_1753927 [Lactarius quietus]